MNIKLKTSLAALLALGLLAGCGNPTTPEPAASTDDQTIQAETEQQTTESAPEPEQLQLELEQSVQETNYYCTVADLQMVLRAKGIEKSQDELAQEMKTVSWYGTTYEDLVTAANENLAYVNKYYTIEKLDPVIENNDWDLFQTRIKENIQNEWPLFLGVDLGTLYPDLPKADHDILLTGYETNENGQVTVVTIIDPYYNVQDPVNGGLKTFSFDAIKAAICANNIPAYIW